MVKLRQIPEDFIVEELGGPIALSEEDWEDAEHRIYLLRKKGQDTISLLARLSRRFSIPRRSFGICGLKDRHAVTSQLLSAPASAGEGLPVIIGDSIGDIENDGWSLILLGGVENKLRSGRHSGNRFTITVRDINNQEKQRLASRLQQAQKHGWPNWFDSQRFGSAIDGVLPAEFIIERDFESAMKLHLTKRGKSDRADKRRDKRAMAEAWPDISQIEPEHTPFRRPIKALKKAEQEVSLETQEKWKRVYLALPWDIRGLWLSAWQSQQWNREVGDILTETFAKHLLYHVEIGVGGPLLYPHAPSGKRGAKHHLVEDIATRISELPDTIPMPHSDLDLRDLDQHLAAHERELFIKTDVECSELERDEMNGSARHKRWKTTLKFELPTGAYATVLIKRLFH